MTHILNPKWVKVIEESNSDTYINTNGIKTIVPEFEGEGKRIWYDVLVDFKHLNLNLDGHSWEDDLSNNFRGYKSIYHECTLYLPSKNSKKFSIWGSIGKALGHDSTAYRHLIQQSFYYGKSMGEGELVSRSERKERFGNRYVIGREDEFWPLKEFICSFLNLTSS